MDSVAANLCLVDSLLGPSWAFEDVVGAVDLSEFCDFQSNIYQHMKPLIFTTEANEMFHELFSSHEALKALLNIEEPKHRVVPADLDNHRQQLILLRNILAADYQNHTHPEDPTLTINRGNYYISQAADNSPAFARVDGAVLGRSPRAKKQDEAAACKQDERVGWACMKGSVPIKRNQKRNQKLSNKRHGIWGNHTRKSKA